MEDIFKQLTKSLESEAARKDDIRTLVRVNITPRVRDLQLLLQSIHSSSASVLSKEYLRELSSSCEPIFDALGDTFGELDAMIPEGQRFRYTDLWRQSMQQIVFLTALLHWLVTEELMDVEQLETKFKLSDLRCIRLEVEDYLVGLTQLSNELSRLCRNSVIQGHYDMPGRIAALLNSLFSGFRLMTLKNDIVRKRFDSLKYDLKTVEEVVYDLSIRKLTTPAAASSTDTTNPDSTQ